MDKEVPQWIAGLEPEDWQFIKRLLLASGSLKELAGQYGISYPTVRIRLNRLIEKVKILDSDRPRTKFHQKVQLLVAEGKLDISIARALIKDFEQSIYDKDLQRKG